MPAWTGRTRGGYFGNWFFIQLVRVCGVHCAYAWLVFVAAYFTLASPRSYRFSIQFLESVFGQQSWWKRPFLVYRHFFSHGVTLLDRLAFFIGRNKFECRLTGDELLKEQLDQGKGVILLGAHVGSWEIGGQLLVSLGKPVNLVVMEKEATQIRVLFERALRGRQFRLLTIDDHPLRSIPIIAALRRGEIVALHGDRSFGGADLSIPFLGAPARFPLGAYRLSAASGAPIFHVFSLREKIGQYRFFAHPAKAVGRELLRAGDDAIRPYVLQFVERLTHVVRQYPFQWCNFYPFWEAGAAPSKDSVSSITSK